MFGYHLIMKPLAEELRPTKLKDFIDQEHLVGESGPIKKAIDNNTMYSMIFWGMPGCGKTTLARIIANELNTQFIEISPTTSGVKDIKLAVERAKGLFFGEKTRTILFIDEIHRFNKTQQDYLLPHVEAGTITLIGATTENPSFSVISPLLSRTRVYKFNPISRKSISKLITKAVKYLDSDLKLTKDGKEFLVDISNGDARNILNAIETLILTNLTEGNAKNIKTVLQQNLNRYDKKGDEHYDTISAYIKSMRASDVNAAIYYLAKMIDGGEDPKFIARRMVIFASEDIGIANSNALIIANEVYRAVETVGYPECRINLAHGTVYLAKSPKNRSCYDGIGRALEDIKKYGNLSIPLEIRNAPTYMMKEMGYGKNYNMYPEGKSYLPDKIKDRKYI